MPHFKAFGMMNLQYVVRICHKIHNKGTMSQWQIQVTIFLSETDEQTLVLLAETISFLSVCSTNYVDILKISIHVTPAIDVPEL